MKKKLSVLAVMGISISISAQQLSLKDTININEVVVTGSKTLVNRNNVPVTVSVISNDKINNSSESALLPVLSSQVPGLFVTERGITGFGVSGGSAGQITIRGVGGSPNTQVLVLVDGNPQFMGIMGHPLPDAYVASDAEKVEVIRGAASTLYGTNAMGGVINIITKEQKEDGASIAGRMMYGSYDTRKYMLAGGLRDKKLNLYVSFNHDQTDGHRSASDFRINNGYLKAGYELNSNFNLSGNLSLANFNATDPGFEGMPTGYSYDILRGMAGLALNNTFSRTNGSVRLFYNFGEHDITDGFHSNDRNLGAVAYQAMKIFKGNTITLGLDYKTFGGIAGNNNGNGTIFADTVITETAGYVFVQQDFKDMLTLNAGFRLEYNSTFGLEPVPSAGLAFNPSQSTTIKASLSKGFRSPTIRELYLFAPANDDLRPERMMNYEAGILQRIFSNKISLELTIFNVNGSNLIQTVMTEGGPKNLNSGTFSNTGIEFSGSFRPGEKVTLTATYSYISLKEPITAAPEQQLNINGTYKLKRFSFNLSLQHIQDLYTRIKPSIEQETYTLLNSRISCLINKNLTLFVKGENITNKEYYINYGYPMPGFVAFGGINFNINKN